MSSIVAGLIASPEFSPSRMAIGIGLQNFPEGTAMTRHWEEWEYRNFVIIKEWFSEIKSGSA